MISVYDIDILIMTLRKFCIFISSPEPKAHKVSL